MKYLIRYSKEGPFPAIDLPGCNPSVVLARGEQAEVSEEAAMALRSFLRSGALSMLTEGHLAIEPVGEDREAASPADTQQKGVDATPPARALAQEHGLDLSTVEGSGKDGRITLGDVKALLAEEADGEQEG